MQWIEKTTDARVPIKSWCETLEDAAMAQAKDLASHPVIFHHVALMPDCHVGYGMPIGGVIACREAVIPNAVGVDIGCGMGAVKTSLNASIIERTELRAIVTRVKERVPCGEGHAHGEMQVWEALDERMEACRRRGWYSAHVLMNERLVGASDDRIFQQIEVLRRSLPIGRIALVVVVGLGVAGTIEAHVTPTLMRMM